MDGLFVIDEQEVIIALNKLTMVLDNMWEAVLSSDEKLTEVINECLIGTKTAEHLKEYRHKIVIQKYRIQSAKEKIEEVRNALFQSIEETDNFTFPLEYETELTHLINTNFNTMPWKGM